RMTSSHILSMGVCLTAFWAICTVLWIGPNTSSCLNLTPTAAKLAHPVKCFVVDSFMMMILLSQISYSSIGMIHHRSFGKSLSSGSTLPLVWTKFRYLRTNPASGPILAIRGHHEEVYRCSSC